MSSSIGKEIARKHLTRGLKRLTDLVIEKGDGSRVWTECGRELLDFVQGIAVTNLGHCPPRVVAAVQEQAAAVNHVSVNMGLHRPMLTLAEKLSTVTPAGLDSFFFWNSGAEAVEAAVKVARKVTGRGEIVVFSGSYHGRTMGTMPLTTSSTVYRGAFGPFMPGVHVADYPYCFRCDRGGGEPFARRGQGFDTATAGRASSANTGSFTCCGASAGALRDLLERSADPRDIAAVIVEPVQGEGGYLPCPAGFLEELRSTCDEIGAMLVFDEVQSGAGRTGRWFACEHAGVDPDILVMAKGIASGYPLSAIAASKDVMDKMDPGSLGGTYAGNIVACAAAIATFDEIAEGDVLPNVEARGAQLRAGLVDIASRVPALAGSDVRGVGLMNAIEVPVGPRKTGLAAAIAGAAVDEDLLLLPTGNWDTVRFMPPLNVTEGEINEGLAKFERAAVKATSSS